MVAPKIIRLVNLAQHAERSIHLVDKDIDLSFHSFSRSVVIKSKGFTYRNVITDINNLLFSLREFFDLVQECFEEDEDRKRFNLYSDWYGIDTTPIPHPSNTVEFPWPYEVDVLLITPSLVSLLREYIKNINAS